MADKHVAVILGKRPQEWYSTLNKDDRHRILRSHGEQLRQYASQVTHIFSTGTSAYDEVILIEADDVATIQAIVTQFRSSEKASFFQIVETIVGLKPENIRESRYYYS